MIEDNRVEAAKGLALDIRDRGEYVEDAAVIEGVVAAYEERLRVNVGLINENRELRRKVEELSHKKKDAS